MIPVTLTANVFLDKLIELKSIKSIIVNSVIGIKEYLTFTIFAVKTTATIFNFNSSQYFLQCQGSFINHFPNFLATNTVIQTAFAITTKNSFKSDERPVILTAFVVIYNEFQKCDACRSVIQKLYNI